jgi:hypothetical protein
MNGLAADSTDSFGGRQLPNDRPDRFPLDQDSKTNRFLLDIGRNSHSHSCSKASERGHCRFARPATPRAVMRIRYTIPFKRKLIIQDHWPVPFSGGTCRVVEKDQLAVALEITLTNQPVEYAPQVNYASDREVKMHIIGGNEPLPFVKHDLKQALAFLECFYNVDLELDKFEAAYEPESPDEMARIHISSFKSQKQEPPPLNLPFDILTRALMAAESTSSSSPSFAATLSKAARNSACDQQYIDSFRYSFLLIESIYGDGKFRKKDLEIALKNNADFCAIVTRAMKERWRPKRGHASETETFLSRSPSVEEVIDHLIEKRGFYFHGNIKHKNPWKPHDQSSSESLAQFTLGIAQLIALNAAMPMFADEYVQRHFQNAMKVGAEIVLKVTYKFDDTGEGFIKEATINIRTPGTKVIPRMAFDIAKESLRQFENNFAGANLHSVECTVDNSTEKVFDILFHVKGQGTEPLR